MRTRYLLFAYNRFQHFKDMLESLFKQSEPINNSDIIVFIDYHKDNPNTIQTQNSIIDLLKQNDISFVRSKESLGIRKSILSAIRTEQISQYNYKNHYDSVVIVEDDLVLHRDFNKYMKKYLDLYKDDKSISTVCGYSYNFLNLESDIKIKNFSPWGWGTWLDRFYHDSNLENCKNPNYNLLPKYLRYFRNLDDYKHTKMDIWSLNIHFSNFYKNSYSIMPKNTLVENRGLDGTGVHCSNLELKYFDSDLSHSYQNSESLLVRLSSINSYKVNNILNKKFLNTYV